MREAVKRLDLNDGDGDSGDEGPISPPPKAKGKAKPGKEQGVCSSNTDAVASSPNATSPSTDRKEGEPLSRLEEQQDSSPSAGEDTDKKCEESHNTPTGSRKSSSSQAGSKRPTDDSHDRVCAHDGSKRSGISSCECRDSEKRPKVKKISPPRDRKGGGGTALPGTENRRGKKGRRTAPAPQEEEPQVDAGKQRKVEPSSEATEEKSSGYTEDGVEEGYEGEGEGPQSPQRSDEEEGEGKRDLSKRVAESDLAGPRPKAARTVIPALGGATTGGAVEEGPLEGEVDLAFLLGDATDQALLTVVLLVS